MLSSASLYDFDGLLSESIDKALVDLLGDRVAKAIYQCLEKQGIQRQQIPQHLSKLDDFLEQNFGKGGKVIERKIAKRLYEHLGWQLVEVPRYALTDYVGTATRRLTVTDSSNR